jgi:acyl-CoA reductase-like NAD-dependent aldehyde dehydrogenase
MPARDRARLLQRLATLPAENGEEFAELEAIDAGKSLAWPRVSAPATSAAPTASPAGCSPGRST